ncbi:MAG: TCR/Tet family MFS transporter [Rubrivivax sp.]|nr:TCR/Tet family MFS transporter [Rubrivivax sp.]
MTMAGSSTGRRAAAMPFIMLTVLIDMVAIGLIVPVLPLLVGTFTTSPAQQTFWFGVVSFAFGIANFFGSPVLGGLSDRYGRRPVLLIGVSGLALSFFVTGLATALWMLIAVRLVSGAMQANAAVANAYVADITPPEDRARRFGLVGAMFGLGFILGPAMGGLLGSISIHLPFFVAGALAIVNWLYGWFVLPESLPAANRMAFAWRRANPFGALRLLRSHAELAGLAIVNFLLYFAHHVFSAVFVLYAGHRYGWGALQVGLVLAFAGALDMLVQGVLVGPVAKRLGDRRTMVLGLAGGAIGIACMGLAPNGVLFALTMLPNALWGLAMPTLQALMTRRVSESEQGQLQGANMSVASIAGIFSPLFFGWVYSISSGTDAMIPFIGTSLLLAAVVLAAAALIGARVAGAAERDDGGPAAAP